ncbi:MAG: hypothetical protein ACYCSB_01290 [bacterium]|jgi:hypothetical protein
MESKKVIVLIISNNELKTAKVFNSEYDTDSYLADEEDYCVMSNETFSYAILNEDNMKYINAVYKSKAED